MEEQIINYFGSAELDGDRWYIKAEPHVLMKMRRMFESLDKRGVGIVILTHSPEHCRDLLWFADRYPIDIKQREIAEAAAQLYIEHITRLGELLRDHVDPPSFDMALPPRHYQAQAAAIARQTTGTLVADELGLGKTCIGIATIFDQVLLPAVVVVPAHLVSQWKREFIKFAPTLYIHEIKKKALYELPQFWNRPPDVLVITYHKLHPWAEYLAKYCNSIIWDEVHELRHPMAYKYTASKHIANNVKLRMGLSATPIYNYGGEIFWPMDMIRPRGLGSHDEFIREWCTTSYGKHLVSDPQALGAYLRSEGLMLRRTRKEVGRELPDIVRVVEEVPADPKQFDEMKDQAAELARVILGSGKGIDKMQAAGELDWRLRQATGIAKAPAVAAIVKMLVESGESVVLAGWHRAVYDVWLSDFERSGIKAGLYTGSENAKQKDANAVRFMSGELDVLVLSLRSGAGLDGLQESCSVVVFGELDWSPSVHEQLIGRLQRDGQDNKVVAYYLITDSGSDPIIAEVNGIKRDQATGIINPEWNGIEVIQNNEDRMKKLAEFYLKKTEIELLEV